MLKIFVGTMYGGALDVAEQVKPLFEQAGYDVAIYDQPALEDLTGSPTDLALFCVSTTGSGDYPGNFVAFARSLQERGADLSTLRYGLIALGDSSYGDTFCGAGDLMEEAMAMAQQIAENAPLAVQTFKELAYRGLNMSIQEISTLGYQMYDQLLTTEDSNEGPRAFAEKRKPVWKGR